MKTFIKLVDAQIKGKKLSLRKIAKKVGLDPSFFSKVLSGKRTPPSDEKILKKMAEELGIDPFALIVSTGAIPSELQSLLEKPEFLRQVRKGIFTGPAQKNSEAAYDKKKSFSNEPLRLKELKKVKLDYAGPVPKSPDLSEDLL